MWHLPDPDDLSEWSELSGETVTELQGNHESDTNTRSGTDILWFTTRIITGTHFTLVKHFYDFLQSYVIPFKHGVFG